MSHSEPKADAITGPGPAKTQADVREFFERVLPWPPQDQGRYTGYCSIHWTMPDKKTGRKFGKTLPMPPGRPFQTLDDFMGFIDWAKGKDGIRDLYYCTSLQSTALPSKKPNGPMVAVKRSENALAMKHLRLDLDVFTEGVHKEDKRAVKHPTLDHAGDAIENFCTATNMPAPSALVQSGGGLHVYWIFNRPVTPDEWQPYADGLAALGRQNGLLSDFGCTTDRARIFRVPGAWNCKTDPARPTKLIGLAPRHTDYDPSTFDFLKAAAPHVAGKATGAKSEYEDLPLDPTKIFEESGCGFLRKAVATGGYDYTEPMWNLTTYCATFFTNGRALAHAMAEKHPGYTQESTDAKFDQKVKAREREGLGWPSCKKIQENGCTDCAACPHFAKGKSPLHLALPTPTFDVAAIFGQVKQGKLNPVTALMTLRGQGAGLNVLLAAMNENHAVVKYGGQTVIATITGDDIGFMKVEDFHRMFANLVVFGPERIKVSKRWFEWTDRCQYLGRGVVFEPGRPLEIPNDMLNLWRGFGVAPKPGDWSLMRDHILNVVCSGQQDDSDYLIKWMAYAVQNLDKPIGVAVAFLGSQGAGKGVVARTFGSFFGKHFVHITHGDQLTGRFNASLGTACAVFLDEALWAGDKKGEGVLKALITEPSFQMEAKFRDPITVENWLRIMVGSNNDWAVPAGVGDRRWFVLNVANTYAGTGHRGYWTALYAEIENGGAAAMLHDLLAMDLSGFDVRAIPHTTAKAQQQAHSFRGTMSWLYDILQEGAIGYEEWKEAGLTINKNHAYDRYKEFSKEHREWQPDIKDLWSKKIRNVLGPCVEDVRQTTGKERVRSFKFASLADCRRQFETHVGAQNIEWEPANAPEPATDATVHQTADDLGDPTVLDAVDDAPSIEWEPELAPENWPEDEPDYEPEYEPDCDPECEPANERGSD